MVDLTDEDALAAVFRLEWGYTTTNGQIVAKICPVCSTSVPYGSHLSPTDSTSTDNHREYHLSMARLLARLPTPDR